MSGYSVRILCLDALSSTSVMGVDQHPKETLFRLDLLVL